MKTATFRNCPIFEGSVCSGHGHCRQSKGEGLLFGVCECYSGFAGLDCRETLQQLRDRLAARAFNEDSYCKIDIDEVCPHGVSAALCDALKSSTGLRPPASEDTSEQWTRVSVTIACMAKTFLHVFSLCFLCLGTFRE